jgi:uncharacterized Ntn-hydrolase superfamily protein
VTFSIVGRSADGSQFGVAISSSSPAVAARCSHARAGIGAVASQNITDPALGGAILALLAAGAPAGESLASALGATPYAAYRQVLALGRAGEPATHSGAHTLGLHATAIGGDCAAGGNLLANTRVPQAMVAAFTAAQGPFAARLLAALRDGLEAGGEAGPVHSAGLLVVRDVSWPVVDLRVDWHESDPIGALEALWGRYAPQVEDYIRRAVDPSSAPRFGVPGDP